jgi:hypothetical protein
MPTRRLLLSALAVCLVAGAPICRAAGLGLPPSPSPSPSPKPPLAPARPPPAAAFRACTKPVTVPSGPLSGHWPDPRNSSAAGTRKWAFDWRVNVEGIEISNVRYTRVLGQPKKLVLSRASLPFLPVHYPDSQPPIPGSDCLSTSPGFGFSDTLSSDHLDTAHPFCCNSVPITVCNLPDRARACLPLSGTVGTCPKSAISCGGVCVGTQIDTTLPLENGKGEAASSSSSADILLSATFDLGGYQFVQRWRFRDNGSILPSLRAGGIHDCQWHNHQIYWRFHFQLANSPAAKVQQCDPGGPGGCAGAQAWSTITCATCGNRPSGVQSQWRISDSGVPGRAVIVQTNTAEAADDPSTFCENTDSECGAGGCVNARDFCALGANEMNNEGFVSNNCNDHLPDASPPPPACSGLSDVAFWYIAHVNHHDPCTFLPMCDPKLGDLAFGPTIWLVGSW